MNIDAALSAALQSNTDAARTFPIIISFHESKGQDIVRTQVLHRLGIEPTAIYQNIAAAAAFATPAQIEALAVAAEVKSIEADPQATVLPKQ